MMNPRTFSQSSYDKNDNYAKTKIIPFLENRGHQVVCDEETYKHDLITIKDGKEYYFEFEVKRNYPFTSVQDYKFTTVSFTGRKQRLHNIEPFFYMILCFETNTIVFCHSSEIYKDNNIVVLNLKKRDRKGIDTFYRVDKYKCTFVNLD